MLRLFVLSLVLGLILAQTKEDDEIKSLPGLDFDLNFHHYSGYLKVNETRFLHYWLVTSQTDPDNDPLIFWFTGGPGCSSMLGLLSENGPYLVKEGGQGLRLNPDAWNKNANVVYLESPAGVGYSYATEPYIGDDDQTAREARNAIVEFLKRFPEFKNRQVFITGESYGGIYIPMVAVEILNKQEESHVNLTGLSIGNGCSYGVENNNTLFGLFKFAYHKGAIDLDFWVDFSQK